MAQLANTVMTIPAYISNDAAATSITVTDPISGAKTLVYATGYYEFVLNDGTGIGTRTDPWHALKLLAAATTTNWLYSLGNDGRITIQYIGTGTATFVFATTHVRNLFGFTSSTLTFSGPSSQTATYPVFGVFLSKSRKGDSSWRHVPGHSVYQITPGRQVIGWNDGNDKQVRSFTFDFLPKDQNSKTSGMVSTPAYPVSASEWNTTPTALSYTPPYTALRFAKETQGELIKLYLGSIPYNGTSTYFNVYQTPESIKKSKRFPPSIPGNETYLSYDEVEVLEYSSDSGEAVYATGSLTATFTPIAVSGLQAWWQADDVTLSGGKITQFNDKSGNGRHAANANTTYQLTQSVDAAYNSKTIAVANGNGNQVYAPTSFTVAQTFTIFVVGNGSIADWETFIDSANADRIILRKDPSHNIVVYAGSSNVTVATHDSRTPVIAWCEYNGASSKGNVNSNTATTLASSPGVNSLTQPQLFGGYGGGVYPLANGGKFAALLIYNRALTTDERTNVMNYFATYYGITLS